MAHRSWTATIIDLAPTSATSAVERPPGTVVLTIGWDLSSPTPERPTPSGNVICTQSEREAPHNPGYMPLNGPPGPSTPALTFKPAAL
jgi:hypothetical protein